MLHIAKTTEQSKMLSRDCRANKLRRLYQGIYTDDLVTPLEDIVQQTWMAILPSIVSQGILAYRTAIDLKPYAFKDKSIIFVVSTYNKTIELPGLTIKVLKGDNKQFTEQVLPELARSNTSRALLENLKPVRGSDYTGIKNIDLADIEKILTRALDLHGEKHVNQIRDDARNIAGKLGMDREYLKLNQMIGAILSTHPDDGILSTAYAKAAAQKCPYDEHRVKLFDELVIYLKQCHFAHRKYDYDGTSYKNISFYESYFSNFIEGTEFLIDEAEDIVFKGIEVNNRHADSHDVLSHFTLSNDHTEMTITPNSADEFVDILQRRHAILMKERPEKRPGKLKEKPNRAGNTLFVSPQNTLGTLHQGYERYQLLNDGLEKAFFMQFLISEVHPFDDGNGRLARVMMNAELVTASLYKIIVPTVHRDNYLNGLRLASRDHQFRTYVRTMDQTQAYVASINWHDYGEVREKLETDNADATPDEGVPTFNHVLRQLKLSDIPA